LCLLVLFLVVSLMLSLVLSLWFTRINFHLCITITTRHRMGWEGMTPSDTRDFGHSLGGRHEGFMSYKSVVFCETYESDIVICFRQKSVEVVSLSRDCSPCLMNQETHEEESFQSKKKLLKQSSSLFQWMNQVKGSNSGEEMYLHPHFTLTLNWNERRE